MTAHVLIRKDSYHDSVLLMRVSRELEAREEIEDAVVAMGTPHNLELLGNKGFAGSALAAAGSADLVIAVRARNLTPEKLETAVDGLLAGKAGAERADVRPATLTAALRETPEANLVLVSVPGEHATREARRALGRGRHVMIFSDHVPVEDEIALKAEAAAQGLLVMGPDCGTAIINGKPLAFANVVRRGSVGIVGASGTGIQEISCLVHRLGGGVSQAVGTGGRDLSDEVGGAMTLLAIRALAAEPRTRVLVVVSKPPSPPVAESVIQALKSVALPGVVHFVGAEPGRRDPDGRIVFADTLAGAAEAACDLAGITRSGEGDPEFLARAEAGLAGGLSSGAALRGLFCGGTTAHEALVLLRRAGLDVSSNLGEGALDPEGGEAVAGHAVWDLGDDAFTRGRPHPMIEPELRNERLTVEMSNPAVELLLFDVVLGYGSHGDPAGVLARGVERARRTARERDRELAAVASIVGTPEDPQGYDGQRRTLESAGLVVAPDNRSAARLAAAALTGARS